MKELIFLFAKIVGMTVVLLLVFIFMYGIHRSVEPVMAPAIQDGDLVLFYRLDKTYAARDVLLLKYKGQYQVRRVVATAGDTVDITEEGLLINGALQQESGIHQKTERYVQGVTFPLTVAEDQVFVLADSRKNSTDSRIYGAIAVKDTLGKVITILRRRNI